MRFLGILLVSTQMLSSEEIPMRTEDGFLVPQPGTQLVFPEAHGSHPEYGIEWWYITGHLFAENGKRRFGFQATFFRSGLEVPENNMDEQKAYRSDTLFLGHMALTDVESNEFHSDEHLSRASWDAYARVGDCDVRIQNWRLRRVEEGGERFELSFTPSDGVTVDLQMSPIKSLIRFGEDGTSRKGAHPEARSFYLTFSRMVCEGEIRIGDEVIRVKGESWMDHEIASRQLDEGLDGWDWTAIQFDDGWEMKAYILRRPDGTADEYSKLIWIDPNGQVTSWGKDHFEWNRTKWWTSEKTDVRYPIGVVIKTTDPRTGELNEFGLKPILDNQELANSSAGFPYWEGPET